MQDLDKDAAKFLQTSARKDNDPRDKIAILDTGYDRTHPFFNERKDRIMEFKSFVPGVEDAVDVHGHGTFTADLLLSIAKNADVFIGRVCVDDRPDLFTLATVCLLQSTSAR